MLAIRMQRTGRRGHAMFRVVVQDARRTPTSGKVVARLGSYDPHAKTINLDKEKAAFYLEHGAQPSDRIARLLKQEGVKLPDWVKLSADKQRTVRNPDKRRSTRPDEPAEKPETAAPEPDAEAVAEAPAEAPAEQPEASTETAPDEASETAESPEAAQVPAETAEEPASETTEKPQGDNQEAPAEQADEPPQDAAKDD